MISHGRLLRVSLLCCLSLTAEAFGQTPLSLEFGRSSAVPSPLEDDANLRDVQFVGGKVGWAVGDRGVVWRTTDGGVTWKFLKTPVDCSLNSVCFLTDRVGWIVGGGTTAYTRLAFGIVLSTSDGGDTWQQVATGQLPRLHAVKFFDLTHGIAVGDATSEFSTGLLMTEDGGKTWQPIPGLRQTGWRTACFLMPEVGAVAGQQGKAALVGGGRLLQPRLRNLGLRGLRDVEIRRDDTGWLVGDGGLVRYTDNGGVVWQEPKNSLPEGTAEIFDFRAVDCRGQKAWIAGEPGSIIWHTPDGGQSWIKQHTKQTQPINALWFVSDAVGYAAGDLGLLLKTADGGETWKAIRGGDRRVAMISVPARPSRVSANLLVQYGGELGYRSLVLIPTRRDVGPNGHRAVDLDLRLQDGVTAIGGSAAQFDWQFPLVLPGLTRNREKLIADWNRRTDGRLPEVFLGKLVARLRTWRPSIVIIDRVAADDAVSDLLQGALLQAVEQAADPTRYVKQQQLAGLLPWRVAKVYQRLPAGSTGDAHVNPHYYLPRLGSSVQAAAAAGFSMFASVPRQTADLEAYRLIAGAESQSRRQRLNREFFTGIPLTPDSAARRKLPRFDERGHRQREKLARRQRDFQAIAERYLDDQRHAAQLIAQLRRITAGMSDAQAALQLSQLAAEYRERAEWDLAEATMVELVERFPNEPVSHLAMRRLFRLWSGAEPAWQRARKVQVNRGRFALDIDALRGRIEKAEYLAKTDPSNRTVADTDLGPDPLQLVIDAGPLKIGENENWRRGAVKNWLGQAARMASLLRLESPALYRTPEVQFSLASLLRQRGTGRGADRLYLRYDGSGTGDYWKKTAAGELWLLRPVALPPKTIGVCKRTTVRPVLDGVLSDVCWQNADEFRLSRSTDDNFDRGAYAFVMLSYDDKYLYFAASVPRDPDAPDVRPMLPGRTHDADLRDHDRVSLLLDIDRDYATYYSLAVDQRGKTHDACWEDTSWNPKWYVFVAADADGKRWRIEAAIPLEELTPVMPVKNTVWAIGLLRTIPAVRLESWTQPASSDPRPETFGLLRFD